MIEVAAFMITGEDVHLVAHDQLLGQALGDRRGDAARVLPDELDFLAGDGVAVLLHVKFDAGIKFGRGVRELARIGQNDADLDRALGVAGNRHDRCRKQGGAGK